MKLFERIKEWNLVRMSRIMNEAATIEQLEDVRKYVLEQIEEYFEEAKLEWRPYRTYLDDDVIADLALFIAGLAE